MVTTATLLIDQFHVVLLSRHQGDRRRRRRNVVVTGGDKLPRPAPTGLRDDEHLVRGGGIRGEVKPGVVIRIHAELIVAREGGDVEAGHQSAVIFRVAIRGVALRIRAVFERGEVRVVTVGRNAVGNLVQDGVQVTRTVVAPQDQRAAQAGGVGEVGAGRVRNHGVPTAILHTGDGDAVGGSQGQTRHGDFDDIVASLAARREKGERPGNGQPTAQNIVGGTQGTGRSHIFIEDDIDTGRVIKGADFNNDREANHTQNRGGAGGGAGINQTGDDHRVGTAIITNDRGRRGVSGGIGPDDVNATALPLEGGKVVAAGHSDRE